jgi:hypothetical protein
MAVLLAEAGDALPSGAAAALAVKAALGAVVGLPLMALLARRPWSESAAPVPAAE